MSHLERDPRQPAELPRLLGPFDASMVVVGSVIGSGIFLKPGLAAAQLPSFGMILVVWIGVGLVTLCGCLALAELAAMLPRAGGPYVYLREAYGPLAAFLWGWTEFLVVRTGSTGALAVATTIYLSQIVPLSIVAQEGVTIGLVLALCGINLVSTRWVSRVQNLTALLKVGFLGLIIVIPYLLGRAESANLQPVWPATWSPTLWRGLGMAMIAVMWPYDGWINIGPVAEEIRDPQRNVPRGLIGGFLIVMFVYVAANVAYHLVLPYDVVAGSSAVAFDFFRALLGSEAARWVALGVMISTFGAVNANVLTGPRILFAMARDGLLPRQIAEVHANYATPYNAILLQGAWSIGLIVLAYHGGVQPREAFDALTNFVVFGGSLFYALAVASVYVLRFRHPGWERPYRTWGYPLTPALYLLAFGGALVSLLLFSPRESLGGCLLIAAGVPFYLVMRRVNRSTS